MRWAHLFGTALALLGSCSITPPTDRAFCSQDSDCAPNESCVSDLTSGVSYCAQLDCKKDSDCPSHQLCRTGVSTAVAGTQVQVCIDRVRACAKDELCNGLDDDCDGIIDGAACAPITGCLDDAVCGVFVCSAPENQSLALCAPANEAPTKADFELCTAHSDCRNGVCDSGRCSPFCRPSVTINSCRNGFACTRTVGPGTRPAYNTCQKVCDTTRDCSDDPRAICVWRDVYQGRDEHGFVCAVPESGRRALGANCPRNTPEGDDQCQTGLCFGCSCTRPCANPNEDCTDVAADAICSLEEIRYGALVYQEYICVSHAGVCGG